jgi:valyl-tRNA synthetase
VEADWGVARRLGWTPVEVVDADGVVRAAGPLDGLARFAARRAARDALDAAGLIVDSVPITEDVRKCGRCGAVLVPRLGAHWFLATQGLEAALADALREEAVAFAPPTVQDALVEALGGGREWCLSHQVWAGQAVPVARCLDCGQLAVEVEQGPSCGKCMGALQPDDDVLDADFVAALWPLAIAGWPADEQGVDAVAAHTTVVVDERGLELWVVPAAALALRLTGALPFRNVVVVEGGRTAASDDTAEAAPPDVVGLVDADGARVVRAALVAGALDLDAARVTVDAIEAPPPGDDADTGDTVADLDTALDAAATAIAGGAPGVALDVLATALSSGARPTDAARAHALAGFVLGD